MPNMNNILQDTTTRAWLKIEPVRVAPEGMLGVLDNDSTCHLNTREAQRGLRWFSHATKCPSWYRTYLFQHNLLRGAGELGTSWSRGQPQVLFRTASLRLHTMEKGLGESLLWACAGPSSLVCLSTQRRQRNWLNKSGWMPTQAQGSTSKHWSCQLFSTILLKVTTIYLVLDVVVRVMKQVKVLTYFQTNPHHQRLCLLNHWTCVSIFTFFSIAHFIIMLILFVHLLRRLRDTNTFR